MTTTSEFFTQNFKADEWTGTGLELMQYLQEQCAERGFDLPSVSAAVDKIKEEAIEIAAAATDLQGDEQSMGKLLDELGDMFFTLINVCRLLQVSQEEIILNNAQKFFVRIQMIEQALAKNNLQWKDVSYEEIVQLWQLHKDE